MPDCSEKVYFWNFKSPQQSDAYAEYQKKKEAEVLPVYDLVAPDLGNSKTSKLTVEISKDKKSETLDCGSAIRKERK